jgi:hypothetical protein
MPTDPKLFAQAAEVRPAHTASERVSRAMAYSHAAHVHGMQRLDAMRKAGLEMIALMEELPKGTFGAFTREKMPNTPPRTIRYWMSAARNWKRIQNAATHAEADEIMLEGDEPDELPDDPGAATVAADAGKNDEKKTKRGKKVPAAPPAPPKPETPVERVKRHVSALLDKLAEINLDMEDVIRTPVGLAALEVAEELKVKIDQEFRGQEDRFGRESDTKGERHYYPQPVKELIQWWTAYLNRLENPTEVDF